jgi:hypothetical protein
VLPSNPVADVTNRVVYSGNLHHTAQQERMPRKHAINRVLHNTWIPCGIMGQAPSPVCNCMNCSQDWHDQLPCAALMPGQAPLHQLAVQLPWRP